MSDPTPIPPQEKARRERELSRRFKLLERIIGLRESITDPSVLLPLRGDPTTDALCSVAAMLQFARGQFTRVAADVATNPRTVEKLREGQPARLGVAALDAIDNAIRRIRLVIDGATCEPPVDPAFINEEEFPPGWF